MTRKPGSPPRSTDEPRADERADERRADEPRASERAEPQSSESQSAQRMDDEALTLNDREWLALGDDEEDTLSPEEARELMSALSAAWRPDTAASPHPTLLALALDDPDAPASSEEQAGAAALAQAWERGAEHPLADLGRAALAAHSPGRIDPARNQALIQAALQSAGSREDRAPGAAQVVSLDAARRRRALLGSLSVLAAAAAMWLWLGPALKGQSPAGDLAALPAPPHTELAVSRSTGPLFAEKFDTQGTSERMDRIASARARDLRHNRYARWGAR
ncbi:MAG: hypothetical protein KIT72_13945 [Polyangiaceae bacterium]|nr:hypothetical protein [Polyangiaceae bacterium]MCW5791514.1 hypothetical protein [Polyangiaceae bacterium]